MFHDMPEMTPGAQITKKTHIKIHVSPASQQQGFQSTCGCAASRPRSKDQSMKGEQSIAATLEAYLSHPNPWRLSINNMMTERTPVIGMTNLSDTLR